MSDVKKPPEGKKSFAEALLKGTETAAADGNDPRTGYTKEWQPAALAFNLRLWFKDGRRADGIPWALYSGDAWRDGVGAKPESLTLTFSKCVITVEGYNLKRLIDQIDQGHLKSIREHDNQEVALLKSEVVKNPAEAKAVITRLAIEPPIEELAEAIRKGER